VQNTQIRTDYVDIGLELDGRAYQADIAYRTTAELSPSVTRRPSGPRRRPAALRQRHRRLLGL